MEGKGDAWRMRAWQTQLLNTSGWKRRFIIDETPQGECSGSQVMERFSPPAASLKKRISPPIAWNLGLANKEPKIIRVILLGHQGVGKTGKNSCSKAWFENGNISGDTSVASNFPQNVNVLNVWDFLNYRGTKSSFSFRCTTRQQC